MDWFPYDNGLRHERVKVMLNIFGFSHVKLQTVENLDWFM